MQGARRSHAFAREPEAHRRAAPSQPDGAAKAVRGAAAGRPEAAMSVDYARFFAVLCGGGVEFILVRGTAANVHRSARLTPDVGIVYPRSPQNVATVVAALGPLDPYPRRA